MKRQTAISFDTFVKILHSRMEGAYHKEVIRNVIELYTSSTFGILPRIVRGEEFNDKYFGGFRYTEKGFETFKSEVKVLMRQKLIMAKIAHETARRKKGHEKRNKMVWIIGNAIEGYRYVYKVSDIKKEKTAIKVKQGLYHADRRRANLKIAKKIRRTT